MTVDTRHDGTDPISRIGGARFVMIGAVLTVLAVIGSVPSLRAGAVVTVVAAVAMAWAASFAVRVVRQVGHPSRQAWMGFSVQLAVLAAATAATGIATWTEGAGRVRPEPVLWIWAACGAAVVVSAIVGTRGMRPSHGWREILDHLLVIVIVTMTVVYIRGSSPVSPHLPDVIEVVAIGLSAIAAFSILFVIGLATESKGQSTGPILMTFSAGTVTLVVVILNLVTPVRTGWIAATAALTIAGACMWTASALLRLRTWRGVRVLPSRARPSMWRELLPALVLAVLVIVVFLNGGVGAFLGALVAAGLVAGRMTLTLVQYRRLLDQEHDRLTAHERALIEERYMRFALENTQTELVEDYLRLRDQERDRVTSIRLLHDAVLVPARELRADLVRISSDSNVDTSVVSERIAQLGIRAEAVGNALDDLVTYSLIVEGELSLTRSRVAVDTLLLRVIHGLDDVTDRTGVVLQIDGEASAGALIDPALISQVLRRLIVSALLSNNGAGPVTVLLRQSDDVMVIEISDRGPSYAPDDLPYLFIPFYRPQAGTREPPGCVGLALANARSILGMHGGVIRVLSPSRGGVQIRISLPVDLKLETEGRLPDDPEAAQIAGMLPTE